MAALNYFTPTGFDLLAATSFAQVKALPGSSDDPTVLVTNISGPAGIVLLCAAAATHTGTGTAGSLTVSLDSASSVVQGQLVLGTGVAAGTTVVAISGTTITLSKALTATLSGSTNLNFFAAVTNSTGVAIAPNSSLAIGRNSLGYICYISSVNGNNAYADPFGNAVNVPSLGPATQLNIASGA